MAIDLADLLSLKTAAQLYNEMLAAATAARLRVANWRTGGPYKTLLGVESVVLEKLYALATAFVQSGFLRTARGAWLTLLAASIFGEERMLSVSTEGVVLLTAIPGAGPYTISPGALIVSTPAGQKYRSTNAAALTLPAGGTLQVPVKAERPGAQFNVGVGAIIQLDAPTILGVIVDNPAGVGGDWITVAGADEEQDEKLIERCLSKWGTLATGSPESAYRFWALSASAEVTKVGVHSNLLAGTFAAQYVTLVLGGDGASVSDAAVAAVKAKIDPLVPAGTKVDYQKAVARVVTLTGTVFAAAARLAEARAGVQASLDALARAQPLGAEVYRTALIDAIHYQIVLDGVTKPGAVRNVELLAPAGDTVLTYLEFLRLANGLAFVGV